MFFAVSKSEMHLILCSKLPCKEDKVAGVHDGAVHQVAPAHSTLSAWQIGIIIIVNIIICSIITIIAIITLKINVIANIMIDAIIPIIITVLTMSTLTALLVSIGRVVDGTSHHHL